MGLFSKSEPCPICGGEVKGLFLTKIADKKTLCKDCSKQISMDRELLKTMTPDDIRKHLAFRRENAQRYAAAHWDAEYDALGLHMGVDLQDRLVYIKEDALDDEDNPVVFSFDQITGYELCRLKKQVDSADDEGETALETGLSVMGSIVKLAGKSSANNTDFFLLRLTTTDKYWPQIELKLVVLTASLYGPLGCANELKAMCQIFKRIVRKEEIQL